MLALPRWLRVAAVPAAVAAAVTGAAPGFVHIRVAPGDTLSAIAARTHTTVAELVALNHLPGNGDLIYAGQTLDVPCTSSTLRHVVAAGDTVDGLAARFGVSPDTLVAANQLPASGLIRLGETLSVPVSQCPGGGGGAGSGAGSGAGGDGGAGSASGTFAGAVQTSTPVPSRDAMAQIIAATARQLGVDPALAQAISWQEAGFNQDELSAAGAIGAMQVTPATGAFVSRYVLGRPLDLFNGYDNALAGVAYLKTLLAVAPLPQAIAGYYQGFASVRANGQFADTRRYVADVLALRSRLSG